MDNAYGLNPAQYSRFSRWHKIIALLLLLLLFLLWMFGYGPNAYLKCLPNSAAKVEVPAAAVTAPAPTPPIVARAPEPVAAPQPPEPAAITPSDPATTTMEAPPPPPTAAEAEAPATAELPPAKPAIAPSSPPAKAKGSRPSARLYFASTKHDLPGDVANRLAKVIEYLGANPTARVALSGFHDRFGSRSYNLQLAEKRAAAVRQALEKAGIRANRIVLKKPTETTGSGKSDEARRVEVKVTN